jgi:hypothetical protein
MGERLEVGMIAAHVVSERTHAIAVAGIKVARLNDVVVSAQLLEVDSPLVPTALALAIVPAVRLVVPVRLLLLALVRPLAPVLRLSLCPHNCADDIQRRVAATAAALTSLVDDIDAVLRARFAVHVDAEQLVVALQPRSHHRGQIQLNPLADMHGVIRVHREVLAEEKDAAVLRVRLVDVQLQLLWMPREVHATAVVPDVVRFAAGPDDELLLREIGAR